MKTPILSIVFFLTYNSLFAQNNPDSLIRKLKVREELVFQDGRQAAYLKFNPNGNIIDHKYDDFIGGPISTSSHNTYNEKHLIIQSKSTHSSYPKDTTVWNYQYDDNGNLSLIKDAKGHVVFNYIYDSLGRKVKELRPDSLGNITSITTYTYDKHGNETEELINNKYIKNRSNRTYYDSLNRVTRSESIDNKSIRFTVTYFYYPNTNLIAKKLYDEDGLGSQLDGEKYEYDDNARLIKRLLFDLKNGKETITNEEEFSYFDNNLIKSYSENINSRQKRTFTYSYTFTH